jgi:tetratricopeptide (TPR) repeat protein
MTPHPARTPLKILMTKLALKISILGSLHASTQPYPWGTAMNGRLCHAMILMLAALPSANARATGVAQCTLDQVHRDPQSVIEPCSATIGNEAASAKDRGFALFIRGKGYHNTKRLDLAREDYDAAIKLTPENEELFVSRANIYFRAGDAEQGVSFLQKALDLNPKNGHALRSMGSLFDDSGQREQAERFYTMALEVDPRDAYALLFRSKNYAGRRDFVDALKDADALVSMPAADINLQGYLDEYGDRLDFHIVALKNRSLVHEDMGRSDLAEADVRAAVDYNRCAQSLLVLGAFLAGQPGREDDALGNLDEAIRLGSLSAQTYYAKASALLGKNERRGALLAFDQAGSLDPPSSYALLMGARLHREFDETDAAVDDIARAIAIDPDVRDQTVGSLRRFGYWRSAIPDSLTPELTDALRACMLDKGCN